MSKYRIGQPDLNGLVWIEDTESEKVFNGYDFMGSVNWEDYGGDAYWAEPDEAEQIIQDLEAADDPAEPNQPQEDPMMEMFQRSLDAAVTDRDYYGHKWHSMTEDGHSEIDCRRMYIRYQQAQGFLEGLTNGIFIAGYNIRSTVDSTKMIVTK